jgi:WD40 repeat protein
MLTDEKMCLRILFNDVLLCLITLHPDCIKIWDIRTGKLLSVYRELSTAELTACVLDTRKRKLFVGDAEGNIFTVNIKNGAKMKKFEKHNKMIQDITHWTSAVEVDAFSNSSPDEESTGDSRR